MNYKDLFENARMALSSHGIEVTADYGKPLTNATIDVAERKLGSHLPADLRQLYMDLGDGLHFGWDIEGRRHMGLFELAPLKDLIKEHKSDKKYQESMLEDVDDQNEKRTWANMLKWINFHAEGNGDMFALDTTRDPHPVVFNQHDRNDGGDATNGFLLGDDLGSFMTKWGSFCFQCPKSLWWPSVRKDFRVNWDSEEFSKELTIAGLASSTLMIKPDPGLKARRRLSELIDLDDLEGVRQIFRGDMRIESLNEHGDTGLHEAVEWGYVGIAEFFIKSGIDINVRNKLGQTPLMYAAMHANEYDEDVDACIQMLLKYGADAKAVDCDGINALKHLRQYYENPRMEKLLKNHMKK